mmetsp:Transcript_26702/g.70840  ORF Transcript_26702/g.70840 Transcript_26702/m.70840 type:complete len:250 (+) Transcript_26702:225-974(+)
MHLRATLAWPIASRASCDPRGTELGEALQRVHAERAAGVVDIEVAAARVLVLELDAAEGHTQNLTGWLVHNLAVKFGRAWVCLLELQDVLEVWIVRVGRRPRPQQLLGALQQGNPAATDRTLEPTSTAARPRDERATCEDHSERHRRQPRRRRHEWCCSTGAGTPRDCRRNPGRTRCAGQRRWSETRLRESECSATSATNDRGEAECRAAFARAIQDFGGGNSRMAAKGEVHGGGRSLRRHYPVQVRAV